MEQFWKILVVINCIYIINVLAIDVATDITENDLNQDEVDGPIPDFPLVLFHSSFWSSKEIKAIVGGCACFWGGIFTLGIMYLSVVFFRKSFNAENGDSSGD